MFVPAGILGIAQASAKDGVVGDSEVRESLVPDWTEYLTDEEWLALLILEMNAKARQLLVKDIDWID